MSKLDHSTMIWQGKRIIVCNGHCCNRDGEVVEDLTKEANGQ